MDSPNVKHISECFIRPHSASEESNKPFYPGPFDLTMLSAHYIQKGLLFTTSPNLLKPITYNPNFLHTLLEKLKHSLSLARARSLLPLAGRLVTKKEQDPHLYLVYVDCSNSSGAKFIHASLSSFHFDGFIIMITLVGGRSNVEDEILCRFIFPERPGALLKFLDAFSPRWNITVFHYSGQGETGANALVGFQVATSDIDKFKGLANTLGYDYAFKTNNETLQLLLH